MTREDKLNACRGEFFEKDFLEKYHSLLLKLHSNKSFMQQIRNISENTAEPLLYGIDKTNFSEYKKQFCDIFFHSLRFADYPEYGEIYRSVTKQGYRGTSATISVFYAMVYLDILEKNKPAPQPQNRSFFRQLIDAITPIAKRSDKTAKQVFSNESLRKDFEKYLIDRGYKQFTPNGNPSTVYDYIGRIDDICIEEHTDWVGLANNIYEIAPRYDYGGDKEAFGNKSHRAVINALLRYIEFLKHK